MKTLITSAGVIRDADAPRTGVISLNSGLLNADVMNELPYESGSIDLSYEEFIHELELQGLSEEEVERECEKYEACESTYLIGDWKKVNGRYEVDKNGSEGFAATYSSGSGNVCVEFSKFTRRTHHTSPCYVMSDGRGPCADLDTEGTSVLAYDLPPEFYSKENL